MPFVVPAMTCVANAVWRRAKRVAPGKRLKLAITKNVPPSDLTAAGVRIGLSDGEVFAAGAAEAMGASLRSEKNA